MEADISHPNVMKKLSSGTLLEDTYTMLKKDEAFRYRAVSTAVATRKESIPANRPSRRNRKVASSVAG